MSTPFKDYVLTPAESFPEDPAEVIDNFCSNFNPNEIQEQLNELLLPYLTTNDLLPQTGKERNNAIFFCEQIWFAAQALHLLRDKITFHFKKQL